MAENEQKGYTIVPNETFKLNLKPITKLVYINLLRYYNKNEGFSYPSQRVLMKDCNLTNKTTLIKAINELEKKDLSKKNVSKEKVINII